MKIGRIEDLIRTDAGDSEGKLIIPGYGAMSPFVLVLSRRYEYIAPEDDLMPKGGPPLPEETVDEIHDWIDGLCHSANASRYEDCDQTDRDGDAGIEI